MDAREAHGEARLVALGGVDRIERDLEHEAGPDRAHRSEALGRVVAHPAVELRQLLVGEAEIGLADRLQRFVAPDPERAAQIFDLQGRTGLPEEVIDADFDNIQAMTERGQFDPDEYRRSPAWRSFASRNPYHLAIVKEDHEHLNRLERSWRSIAQSWEMSFAQAERMAIGNQAMQAGGITPEQEERLRELEVWNVDHDFNAPAEAKLFVWMGKQGAHLYGATVQGLERAQYTAPAGALVGAYMATPAAPVTVGGSIPAGAAAGYGTGWTIGMGIGMAEYAFEHEGGAAYLEYREMGFSHEDSVVAARMVGGVNAVLEAGGAGRILKKLPGVERLTNTIGDRLTRDILSRPTFREGMARFARDTSVTMAIEVGTEIAQESATMAGGEILRMTTEEGRGMTALTFDEYARRVGDIAVETMKSTLLLAGSGPMVNLYSDSKRAHQAHQRQLAWQGFADASEGSDLRQRLPDKYREFVEEVAEGDRVMIDAERFDTYWQTKGHDPTEMADRLGVDRDELSEARIDGGDITIPAGQFAEKIAPTEHMAGLGQDIKTSPEQMSYREAQEFDARKDEFKAQMDTLSEQLENTTDLAARERILNDIVGQLIGARYQPHGAQLSAQFLVGIPNLAERAGMNPEEFYDSVFGGIERVRDDALSPRQNVDMQIDPLLDRLRAGEIPGQREMRGPSLLEFIRDRGGLKDEGGELSARDFGKQRPGLLNNVSGDSIDGMAEAAAEQGYITERDETLLMDAIDQELRGDTVHSTQFDVDEELVRTADQLERLQDLVGMAGLDLDTMTNDEVRAALSAFETYDQLADMDLAELTELIAALAASKDPETHAELLNSIVANMPQLFEGQNFGDLQFADTVRHQRTGQLVKRTMPAQALHRRAVKRRGVLQRLLECVSG